MILDLHIHTEASGDARPTVEEYARWALDIKDQYSIDGFVITEHRYYSASRNAALAELGRETGMVILQGVELETDYGHLLVYGVTAEFLERVNIAKRTDGLAAMRAAIETGGVVAPAHPFRSMVGGGISLRRLAGIKLIEQLNGANDRSENKQAELLMRSDGLLGIGGSDAHFVADFGLCMTRFEKRFSTDRELVEELKRGNYRAIYLEEARHA